MAKQTAREFYPREEWLNSPLSTARFYGACSINGTRYEVDELTGDLCRDDIAQKRRKAYSADDLATIRARYEQKGGTNV